LRAANRELNAVVQALDADPVGFALNHMTPERQLEVARALVLEHFDTLLPDLVKYDQDAAARQQARVAAARSHAGHRAVDREHRAVRRSSARRRVIRAIHEFVPENTDPDVARDFVARLRNGISLKHIAPAVR
jgi:hypothetical protein